MDINFSMGEEPAKLTDLEIYFARIVNLILELSGIILLLLIILSGFKYITASGNVEKAESAKKTLTYAIIGFVLLASSFLILKFIQQFTGVDVTKFQISQ